MTKPVEIPEAVAFAMGEALQIFEEAGRIDAIRGEDAPATREADKEAAKSEERLRREIAKAILLARAEEHLWDTVSKVQRERRLSYLRQQAAALGEEGE